MITIPGYQLEEKLYEGDYSLIFRAHHQEKKTSVIIKFLKEEYPTPQQITRFKHEYQLTQTAQQSGVIQVYQLEKIHHSYAIILEDFGGQSLNKILANKKFSLKEFLQIAIKMTAILNHIHGQSIIHKDINPSNIILNRETGEVKFIDFGISTTLPREATEICSPNLLEGTLPYISPEQTGRMNRGIDYRTDYYSLGVTFYEILTGTLPFKNLDALELVHHHMAKIPTAPHQLIPHLPEAISQIILKLMAKTAEDRYQSAQGILFDLHTCLKQLEQTNTITSFLLGTHDLSEQFKVPEKLYGREQECQFLLEQFSKISNGAGKLLLVAGSSGVGKSSLIHEIYKPIAEQHGYFISGKFDHFKSDIPNSAIIQALNKWVNQILMEGEETIRFWKKRLNAAVHPNGGIITELIPGFEKLLGKQETPAELAPAEAQNRFKIFVVKFIQALATSSHPLVMFLDDLQWADPSSLEVIYEVETHINTKNLFLIGAYRSNEISAAHPLQIMLDKLKKAGHAANILTLSPLSLKEIECILADTLKTSADQTHLLAEIFYSRTEGNPFFINQLLHFLYQKKLIYLNPTHEYWNWDISQIQQAGLTENILELMSHKIKTLPLATQEILQFAACIGHKFDLKTLATVCKKSLKDTANNLWGALHASLIIPENESYKFVQYSEQTEALDTINYRFLHDRVQQACYLMLEKSVQEKIHYDIGNFLLSNTSKASLKETIFDIVNQLNLGQGLIQHPDEIKQFIQLNLMAAQRAKEATAFTAAVDYLQFARSRLSEQDWHENHETILTILKNLAECLYITGKFEQADVLIQTLLEKARTALEKADIRCIQVLQYRSLGNLEEAITCGIAGLALLNFKIDRYPTYLSVIKEMLLTKWKRGKRSIASLIDSPTITEPRIQKILFLLNAIRTPAYLEGNRNLAAILILKSTNLSLSYGNSPESALIYAAYGVSLMIFANELKAGYEFFKLAIAINEKYPNVSYRADVMFLYAASCYPWNFHWRLINEGCKNAMEAAAKAGELLWLAQACQYAVMWDPEMPQDTLLNEGEKYSKIIAETRIQYIYDSHKIGLQYHANIAGKTRDRFSFSDSTFNENDAIQRMQKCHYIFGLAMYNVRKAMIHFTYGDCIKAGFFIEKAKTMMKSIVAGPGFPLFCLYYFLINVALYPTFSWHKKIKTWITLKLMLRKVKIWEKYCPTNFSQQSLLMQAEFARILGKHDKAAILYGKAVRAAAKNDFLNIEALANYLAAKFYISQHQDMVAKTFMVEAYYAYLKWGATAINQYLEETYPDLVSNQLTFTTKTLPLSIIKTKLVTTKSTHSYSTLDLNTVIKASHTLSSEIVLEELLKKMIRIVIECAGAEKGWLILSKNDNWFIEASGSINDEKIEVLQSQPIEERLPTGIINSLIYTKQTVVYSNPARLNEFANDSYIQKNKPKSLLGIPLLIHGELIGMLYLENNLVQDVFTQERLDILNLMTAQMAISLDNAQLYTRLTALNKSLVRFVPQAFLSLLGKESITDIKMGDYIRKDMTILFSDIRHFTSLSEKLSPQENITFLNNFLKEMGPVIRAHAGFIDKYLGDGIMALFPTDADSAVQAAIGMLQKLAIYNKDDSTQTEPIQIGLGLNSGMLMLGTLGDEYRIDGTVISDAVNIAERVQELTKTYGTALLITHETYIRLKYPERYALRKMDTVRVRGKSQPITLYEIFETDSSDVIQLKVQTRTEFENMISLYHAEKFQEALSILEKIIQINKNDVPAQKWLKMIKIKLE